MAWVQVGGAVAGAVLPSLMGGDGGGGSNQQPTQTMSKDPWAAAIPWLTQNLQSGQNLQSQYAAQPFSAQQQQSYGNQFANSDYMRQLTGSVLGQMNQQKPFDRTNPSAKPQGFQLPPMLQRSPTNSNLFSAPSAAVAPAPAPVAAPVVAPEKGADNPAFQSWKQYIGGQGYGADVANYDYWRAFVQPDNSENAGPGVGGY